MPEPSHKCCHVGLPAEHHTRRWSNVRSMLGQRRRRWTNIDPTLDQWFVFAGTNLAWKETLCHRWFNDGQRRRHNRYNNDIYKKPRWWFLKYILNSVIRESPFNYLEGGGKAGVFELAKLFISLMSAPIFYVFYTLHQANRYFTFMIIFCPQSWVPNFMSMGVKETSEVARPNFFKGPWNNYLQHVLQTIIFFMKIQSQNIYFKNTPALWRLNGGPQIILDQ